MSEYIHGIHEACPQDVMPRGWILFLAEVGHSNEPHPGIDFTPWFVQGYGIICRVQHAWGTGGTLPLEHDLPGYLQRVESLARNSQGCNRWIIGNEPNLPVEWPDGQSLSPEYVADVYNQCRVVIDGEVLLAPVAPWNDQSGMGWIEYFKRMIDACDTVESFALHTYSRGSDPSSITSTDRMDAPYEMYYNGFQTYRNWMAAIPQRYRDRPCYISETDQNGAWLDAPNTWCQDAYAEIDAWNQMSGTQKIRAMILYRWPTTDEYHIEGKAHVIADFKAAQAMGYKWTDEPPEEEPMTILNPSLELPYYHPPGRGTIKVAGGWIAFYSEGLPPEEHSQGPCVPPEYKPLPRSLDPRRVVDGDTAQCWFLTNKVMDAGIYQVVQVTPGKRYTFDISLQAWCSNSDDKTVSDEEMYSTLGISDTGSVDPWSIAVQWIEWQPIDAQHRRFVSREVVAEGNTITLFVRTWNKWRMKHNDAYADDAHLIEIDATPPGPEPEPPDPPTPTECNALTAVQITAIVRETIREEIANIRLRAT